MSQPARNDAAPDRGAGALARADAGLDELLARPLAEADLDRATGELAAPIAARARRAMSVLAVRVGGELFAILSVDVAKVVPPARVHRVPHRSNEVLLGIANHDGELLLCMSLEAALGIARSEARAKPALAVIGDVRDRWAFEVDEVVGVLDVAEGASREAPVTVTASRNGCITRLAGTESGEAALLDVQGLASIFRGAVG
jgi:chemotaxis-related protein WspD